MNFDFSKQKEEKLIIKEKTQTTIVGYEEISHIECNDKFVFVYQLKNKKPIYFSKSLNELECKLISFGFLRANHNLLVNMQYIAKLDSKKHQILLANNQILSVSRRKWQFIAEFFNS